MQKQVYEFISKQTNDPIVEWRTCTVSGEEFAIFQGDVDMLDKLSPVIGGKKYALPLPDFCPRVRDLQRLLFKNERFLFKAICGFSGEQTISRFSDRTVYTSKVRHNTDLRKQSYVECNPDMSVQDHIAYLMQETVYIDLIGSSKNIANNARYVNHASSQKDTYLLWNTRGAERSAYGSWIKYCTDVIDCTSLTKSEQCYSCVDSTGLYNCFFVDNADACSDVSFCSYMTGCTHCIFCSGLNNQSYCIDNKKVTKEEYAEFLNTIDMGSYEKLCTYRKKYESVRLTCLRSALNNIGCETLTGNQCSTSSQSFLGYELIDCVDTRYTSTCINSQDLMDVSSFGEGSSRMFMCSQSGNNDNDIYCSNMIGASEHIYYCMETKHCQHCFGCVNLYRKKYCIFNKQYSEEEYYNLLPTLLEKAQEEGMWGVFFDASISPFPYNDTPAIDLHPPQFLITSTGEKIEYDSQGKGTVTLLEDGEIVTGLLDLGGNTPLHIRRRTCRDNIHVPVGIPAVSIDALPDHIDAVDKVNLSSAYLDANEKAFMFVPMEIAFYKKHRIALPREQYTTRHQQRMKLLDKKELYLRMCDKTGKEILSVYPPDAPFKVYSEEAYTQEIYG